MERPEKQLRIDARRIRQAHEQRISDFAANPHPLTVRAEIRALDGQLKEAHSRDFVFQCDEGAIVGGRDRAPSPLTYLVASIGFAILTDIVRALALHDLPVDDLRMSIHADFPLDRKYSSRDTGVAATDISYTVDIVSPAAAEHVREVVEWAERHCHALHTVVRPVAAAATYRLNDAELEVAPSS